MKRFLTSICLITLAALISNCGFKTINEKSNQKFSISEINTTGDKRINFKIRNNLLTDVVENNVNSIKIDLNSNKKKTIKEKNIKNEVTKYQIELEIKLNVYLINLAKSFEININNSGDYLIGSNYSSTLSNEKKLIDNLVDDISKKIIREITIETDDF